MTNDLMTLNIPPFSIRWFEKGEHCHDAKDADLLLVDHGTWEDDAIKFGQEALTFTEPELRGYCWCAHTAIVRGQVNGFTMVSEMRFGGFERRPLYDYRHHLYAVVHFEVSDERRLTAVANDEACEGLDYDWLQYPPLVLNGLTRSRLACTWGDSIICSTHCTMVLMGLSLFPDCPPAMVIPARMALWVDAKSPPIVGPPVKLILTPETPQPNQ
jgi:hypothetical protein